MNRLRVSVWVVLLSAALDAEAAVKLDPCGLLARSEIEAVQGDRVVATKASEPERDQDQYRELLEERDAPAFLRRFVGRPIRPVRLQWGIALEWWPHAAPRP